jgi:hypothetical protein
MSEKIDWIISQLYSTESIEICHGRLNALFEIDNPVPQPEISVPIDLDKMWGIVPPDQAYKILSGRIWDRILVAIADNKPETVKKFVGLLVVGGDMTAAIASKVGLVLSGKILDPNWQPKVMTTLARLAGYDYVSLEEVQKAVDWKNEKLYQITKPIS